MKQPPASLLRTPPPPADDPGARARQRRQTALAEIAELRASQLRGELISKAAGERATRRIATVVIMQFSSIPDRVAVQVGETDEQKRRIRRLLNDELTALRANLAKEGAFEE